MHVLGHCSKASLEMIFLKNDKVARMFGSWMHAEKKLTI